MNWHSITHGISDLGNSIKRKTADLVHDVEHSVAKVGVEVSTFQPFENIMPSTADKLDHFFLSHAGYSFPHTLEVPKPAKFDALKPGEKVPVVSNATLDAKNPTTSFGVHVGADGEARLDLQASGPGTDWGKKGAESAVMSVYVDGKYKQDVVLYGGDQKTPYGLALGKLGEGDHTVTLRYAHEKSTAGAQGVSIASATASVPTYATKEAQWAAEHAPILLGRHGGLDNNHTDTPMGMYHNVTKNADGTTTIAYGYAFSNEDGGTATQPTVEQARWGRLTDLETVYKVTLNPDGRVLQRTYEGAGHNWHDFKGQMDGEHPVIRTATDNNNVTDKGDGLLRFQFPTDFEVKDQPTEDLMRQNPDWFRTQSEEAAREGKVAQDGGGSTHVGNGALNTVMSKLGIGHTEQVADPREYLYVQLKAQGAEADPVAVKVKLKDGRTFTSDQGNKDVAIARDAWAQTTVQLPRGVRPDDVAEVSFDSAGQSHVNQVGHVYMLDHNYEPQELPGSSIKK